MYYEQAPNLLSGVALAFRVLSTKGTVLIQTSSFSENLDHPCYRIIVHKLSHNERIIGVRAKFSESGLIYDLKFVIGF